MCHLIDSANGPLLIRLQAIILSSETFEAEQYLSDSLLGIMFIGTPHAGSDLASFALTLGYLIRLSLVKKPNVSNLKVLEKDSETLAGIQESFSTLLTKRQRLDHRSIEIHCCLEEEPVSGLGHV